MAQAAGKPATIPQNVSLPRVDWLALRLLAREERNNNISAAVSRMIGVAMEDRYGNNWRNQAPLDNVSSDTQPDSA